MSSLFWRRRAPRINEVTYLHMSILPLDGESHPQMKLLPALDRQTRQGGVLIRMISVVRIR